MGYLQLSKKALTGKLIACTNFKDGSFVNLIKLDKPYKDGTQFSVHETTKSAFCSNGLHKNLDEAISKYNRMITNGSIESKINNNFTRIGKYIINFNMKKVSILSIDYEYKNIDGKVFKIEPTI